MSVVLSHLVPDAVGVMSVFHLVSAGSTNQTSVKGSQGQLYGWFVSNRSAGSRKLVFHDTSGTPTAGSGVYFVLDLPAGSAANASVPQGIPFASGIAISTVSGMADSDTTAVSANDLNINLWYK